jgi:hypothetical protein
LVASHPGITAANAAKCTISNSPVAEKFFIDQEIAEHDHPIHDPVAVVDGPTGIAPRFTSGTLLV